MIALESINVIHFVRNMIPRTVFVSTVSLIYTFQRNLMAEIFKCYFPPGFVIYTSLLRDKASIEIEVKG